MNLIPKVKEMELCEGCLKSKSLQIETEAWDVRLQKAVQHLPQRSDGIPFSMNISGETGESYELTIQENAVHVQAESPAGAFYAIQTLRQLFLEERVPCLHIVDKPDFSYRGFYQDVTRGKIPTVATIKKLIDTMAYFKLNSLQLYVEHVFEFEESKGLWETTGYLTGAELREIGEYCKENFIDFIPSLSTFGHMCELLNQEKYRHLRVLKDYPDSNNFWWDRMAHHTINPLLSESFEFVKSLINQYAQHFESDIFNICCDETFDLTKYAEEGLDVGSIYLDFTKKLISHVQSLGKKVMMWGDVLLEHPEIITEFSEDVTFLNWYYDADVTAMEEKISKLAGLKKRQIVCPGTSAWNRFCERIETEEINISKMIELGYKYGAEGVLVTNWGDWGNSESMELCMYGLVLGAEKSWSVETMLGEEFYSSVDALLYGSKFGMEAMNKVSRLNDMVSWWDFVCNYFNHRYEQGTQLVLPKKEQIKAVQKEYLEIKKVLGKQSWGYEEARKELLIASEGICVIAELSGILAGYEIDRVSDTKEWLNSFREHWLKKNKESELRKIEEVFCYYNSI